jgi:cytochrome c553
MRRIANAMGAIALCFAASAQAEGDAVQGRYKAQTCMGCHGSPGYSNAYPTYHVPKLAGQHAEYIVAALNAYAAGQRNHDTMHANAVSLGEQDIADIAAYFSSIERP